ncbi:unnamed protein product [Rhizoctonia solani]|uniref:Transcription factor domain-containing protein n=1 Tax=Rhizoctonia solani TaxID=456999 RepID=A0A8H3D2X4_9AGAM|nr:unnamed protein product [Rhizoctonia solani]
MERILAGRSPHGLTLPALEDAKEPPSSRFSQVALEVHDELEHVHSQDEELDDAASTPINIEPDASTSSFTPPPPSRQWRKLPGSPTGSYPSIPATNYPSGAIFGEDGRYVGGAIPSYDVYQGVYQRPVPAPPVYGRDVILEYFQKWKGEPQPQAYIEDQYTQAPAYGSWSLVGNWWERDDLSEAQRNHLLELVLPYRKQMGLEIWVPQFLASLHLPPQRRPHPGFMWMLYSFAAFFSGNPELHALLPSFLERARRNLDESFNSGDRLFDYIRGQTLYASIKFLSGMVREASMAMTAACYATIMCGLHKISSPVAASSTQDREQSAYRSSQAGFELEATTSPHEHGERIAAFWQLALVDLSAAITTNLPGMFQYDGDEQTSVETVFPRPLEEYISGVANEAPYATLGDFFTSREIPNPPDSALTTQVKATALLERAVRLSTKWSQGKQM